jgi:hypothetical protein
VLVRFGAAPSDSDWLRGNGCALSTEPAGRQISRRARLDRPQGPQIQLTGEFRPRKSKQNQIKPRKNAWICLVLFVRIGAFQGVTANPNKKIFSGFHSPLGLCAQCLRRALLSSSSKAAASRRFDSVTTNIITRFSVCAKKKIWKSWSLPAVRSSSSKSPEHGVRQEDSEKANRRYEVRKALPPS